MDDNKIILEFLAKSQNEAFARVAVAAFVSQLDPTLDELTDVKTAVSEAVTNSIIHGYNNDESKFVKIEATIKDNEVNIIIEDNGVGIDDIDEAREPLFTSKPELERSGMGFTVMESFMDSLEVSSERGRGTKVVMKKVFNTLNALDIVLEDSNITLNDVENIMKSIKEESETETETEKGTKVIIKNKITTLE